MDGFICLILKYWKYWNWYKILDRDNNCSDLSDLSLLDVTTLNAATLIQNIWLHLFACKSAYLARSSALSMGDSILSTVRKAARLAV